MLRYFDGRRWGQETVGRFAPVARPQHPVLPIVAAVGAVVVLTVSLIVSRFLLDALAEYEWPIVVYIGISALVGYGPSVAWCVYASARWGTGRLRDDLGLRLRWSDLGWGPLVWLAALGCELVMVTLVLALGIPLTSNTEGISELDVDRGYVIALLVTAVLCAPVVEELVFRGLMMRGLRSRVGAVATVTVQAALFGVAHFDPIRGAGNFGLVLVLAAAGVGFGGGAYLLRRLGPAIIAHAIFNGVVMAVVLLADP
jgi:membrane protease YdiL (CAAX protease family)